MCNLNEAAHLICGLACGTVQPQLAKLNSYFEDRRDLGIEKWLEVELAFTLREAGYPVKVQEKHRRKKTDMIISGLCKERKCVLELKAGDFAKPHRGGVTNSKNSILFDAGKYADRGNDDFIGCLFLGRFDMDELSLQTLLKEKGCVLTCMQYVGEGSNPTKWWLGVAKKHSKKAAA